MQEHVETVQVGVAKDLAYPVMLWLRGRRVTECFHGESRARRPRKVEMATVAEREPWEQGGSKEDEDPGEGPSS